MSFVYPGFLWALAALAIPVLIHLFNFRRITKVYFSNTRLLRLVKEETTQKRKLKQLLVLASRLLFLLFLILAFAQPFLPARQQSAETAVILYVDNSLSMSAPATDKTSALDQAIQLAQKIVDIFPANVRYYVWTNEFAPSSLVPKTRTEVSDLLAQVKPTAVARTAEEILRRAKREQATLFWISDFQQSTLGEIHPADSTQRIHLVPVATEAKSNSYIDSVFLQNPFAGGDERNAVVVRLRNDGRENREGISVKLTTADRQLAAASIALPAQSTQDVPFDVQLPATKDHRLTVTINDYPVSFDNEFSFVLPRPRPIRIVEVKSATAVTYVERVFANPALFQFQSFTTGNLNYSLLANADLLVVNGINRVDASLADAINSYQTTIGRVLLIPGTEPDIASYQRIAPFSFTLAPKNDQEELDKLDYQNPFFANIFEEKSAAMAMPHASRLLNWGVDRSAILRFKNGSPFLAQQGNYVVLASPLDKSFTDLATHALFVPIMYRLAAGGLKNELPLYYSVNQSIVSLPLDSLSGEAPLRWVGPQEIIPAQRKVNGHLVFDIPHDAIQPGFYAVVRQADTTGTIALNADHRESRLTAMATEMLQSRLGGKNIHVFQASSVEDFAKNLSDQYVGVPLWKYALALALLFLLAEILLIRFLK